MSFGLGSSLAHKLHRLSQMTTERVSRNLVTSGLTVRQIVVLSAIAANDGASQTELVEATGVDRSTLADIVSRLVDRKLVSRRRSKADSRSNVVRLTEEGMSTLQLAGPIVQRVDDDFISALTTDEQGTLLTLLDRLLQTSGDQVR